VAQDVSARASSAGTAIPEDEVHQNQLRLLWVCSLRFDTANSHHVQATQNDSRNPMNITIDVTHRQWRFDASHWRAGFRVIQEIPRRKVRGFGISPAGSQLPLRQAQGQLHAC
jgi:hypothetical protein